MFVRETRGGGGVPVQSRVLSCAGRRFAAVEARVFTIDEALHSYSTPLLFYILRSHTFFFKKLIFSFWAIDGARVSGSPKSDFLVNFQRNFDLRVIRGVFRCESEITFELFTGNKF